jgi:hypothetical protein
MLQLFEKAVGYFKGDTLLQLNRYLLRTLCSDLFNLILRYVSEDNGVDITPEVIISAQERPRVIDALPASVKKQMTAINAVLSGKTVGEFLPLFEDMCGQEYCGVMLKRLDKKKERQLLYSHQNSLLDNLRCEQEPSMVLHLVVVILFQQHTGCAIHISGKLLPQAIQFLHNHVEREKYMKLTECEQLLMKQISEQKGKGALKNISQTTTEEESLECGNAAGTDVQINETASIDLVLQSVCDNLKLIVLKPKK